MQNCQKCFSAQATTTKQDSLIGGAARTSPPHGLHSPGRDFSHLIHFLFLLFLVQQEIWKAAEDIWSQLLSQRRLDLEEAYKMALSIDGTGERHWRAKTGDLAPQWEETMAKAWQQFLGLCS